MAGLWVVLVVPYLWQSIHIRGGGAITSIVVCPLKNNRVYALCDVGGVYRSDDFGDTWRIMNRGLWTDGESSAATLAVHPRNPDILYLGTGEAWGRPKGPYGGLLLSRDGGRSWELLSREVKFCGHGSYVQFGEVLQIAPWNPRRLYAGTYIDGVMRSEDGGRSWERLGLEGLHISSLQLHPKRAGLIVVSTDKGLFISRDDGRTWTCALKGVHARDVALDPADPNTIYVITRRRGVFKSTDGGKTWRAINTGLDKYLPNLLGQSIEADPKRPGVLYVCFHEKHYRYRHPNRLKTTDGGRSWKPIPRSIERNVHLRGWWKSKGWFCAHPHCIEVDPVEPERVYIGDWYTVWRSEDGGRNWEACNEGLETTCIMAIAVHPKVPGVVYVGCADVGFFRTTDGGRSFDIRCAVASNVRQIVVVPDASSWPFRTGLTTLYAIDDGSLLKSRDGGEYWTNLTKETNLPEGRATSVALPPGRPETVYCWVVGHGLLRSDDGGKNWRLLGSEGLPTVNAPFNIALDRRREEVLYLWNRELGIFRSTDGGRSWKRIMKGIPYLHPPKFRLGAFAVDPLDPNVLWAGSHAYGLFRSTNCGESWENILKGFNCETISFDPREPSTIYVGGPAFWYSRGAKAGIWRSTDGGRSWEALQTEGLGHKRIYVIAPDPFEEGKLWVGTGGNGLFVGKPLKGSAP